MSLCSAGDAFRVNTLITYDGGSLDGCYEDNGDTTNGTVTYSLGGVPHKITALAPEVPVVCAYEELSSHHVSEALSSAMCYSFGQGRKFCAWLSQFGESIIFFRAKRALRGELAVEIGCSDYGKKVQVFKTTVFDYLPRIWV